MRILIVSHLFPPAHSAGVEVYASELAKGLLSLGHEVAVLHTGKHVGRANLRIERHGWQGLQVFELVQNLFHTRFEETWNHPGIDARFAEVLDEFQPEVVHFQHLMYLSVGCLALARAKARAVLFTLHDYNVECAAMGQLVHADGSVCEVVDTQRCGTCIPHVAWAQGDKQRRVGRTLGMVHKLTRVDLGPLARRIAGPGRPAVTRGQDPAPVAAEQIATCARWAEARRDGMRAAMAENVQRFLCPSRFLMQRMTDFGLPADRMRLVATGVEEGDFLQPAQVLERNTIGSRPVQITFLGTLIPIKGPHLLLEAWRRLPAELRTRGELTIAGPTNHAPPYVEGLRAAAEELMVELRGRQNRNQVAELLGKTDLLVMPSQWFENRPLILHEALALGVPCLVSDLGGMAELVRPGIDGWHFPMGDARALANRLAEVLREPEQLARLRPKSPELLGWRAVAEQHIEHYQELLAPKDAPRPDESPL